MSTPRIGAIGWIDLTVPDAQAARRFYEEVVGWKASELDMGDYKDFIMGPADGEGMAGICHARGPNEGLPSVWLPYITVESLGASLARARDLGGKVLRAAAKIGDLGRYAVVEDPTGAAVALFEPASPAP